MCSQTTLRKLLNQTENRMTELFRDNLKSVILYGSYARGDYDGDSDIDIMVLVDMDRYALTQYRETVANFVHEIDREYNFEFMLSVLLQDAETFNNYSNASAFFRNVITEGVTVNAR